MNAMPRKALLLALALSGPALAARAQQAPIQPSASQAPQQAAPQAPAAQSPDAAKRLQAVQRQLDTLHDKLGITPAQQPQWAAFVDIRRANAEGDAQAIASRRSDGQESALQMMRDYAQATQMYAQNIQRALPAFEALYGALSPQQKQIADKAFMDRRQEMMRHAGRN